MKTISSRNTARDRDNRRRYDGRDENNGFDMSRSGMEDGWRNEDYYFDRDQEQRNAYNNRDYDGSNYWPSRRDVRDERNGQYSSYVPALDYGRGYREAGRRAVGYGNEGSRYMRDFEDWRQGGDRYEEGYFGRNSDDYRNGYGDGFRYDPSGYDRDSGGFRDSGRFDNDSSRNRQAGSGYGYDYGDYQSYPSYEARGYRRGEYDPGESRRFRNRPRNEGREYGDRHRPSIREKRY